MYQGSITRRLLGLVMLLAAMASVRSADIESDERRLRQAGVATDGPGLLEFFRTRTLNDTTLARIKELVGNLGNEDFFVREKASAALVTYGSIAAALLRESLKSPDAEVVRRAEECLARLEHGPGAGVPAAAARLLARSKPAGAAEALLNYLPFAIDASTASVVEDALVAVARPNGGIDPALVAALGDSIAIRRAAAASILCRVNATAELPAVSKLLADPDPTVRLRTGLGLVSLHKKEAVGPLIELLGELPATQAWQIEDVLYRLAGERAPDTRSGASAADRKAFRDAWAGWWARERDRTDLAVLDRPPPVLGYTMIVLLDLGKILELDDRKKVRWEVAELAFPLDAQWLPGNRLLVAENGGNRVTERNLRGEVLWEHKAEGPLVAQRMANGNTFIATRMQMLEVDREGKQVGLWFPPGGTWVMRAQRLRNGDIAYVSSAGRFVRIDSSGKEVSSFPVEVRTFGGRVEVLPGGGVLIPQYSTNEIVEYDAQGKEVWKASFVEPIAVVRLPNGHTLVTSLSQQRAVELDKDGKEVWEHKEDTRLTRAWRR